MVTSSSVFVNLYYFFSHFTSKNFCSLSDHKSSAAMKNKLKSDWWGKINFSLNNFHVRQLKNVWFVLFVPTRISFQPRRFSLSLRIRCEENLNISLATSLARRFVHAVKYLLSWHSISLKIYCMFGQGVALKSRLRRSSPCRIKDMWELWDGNRGKLLFFTQVSS